MFVCIYHCEFCPIMEPCVLLGLMYLNLNLDLNLNMVSVAMYMTKGWFMEKRMIPKNAS